MDKMEQFLLNAMRLSQKYYIAISNNDNNNNTLFNERNINYWWLSSLRNGPPKDSLK